jgi:hypothetical protein
MSQDRPKSKNIVLQKMRLEVFQATKDIPAYRDPPVIDSAFVNLIARHHEEGSQGTRPNSDALNETPNAEALLEIHLRSSCKVQK